MSLNALKKEFFAAVEGQLPPNEWEIEEYLEPLADLPADIRQEIIRQVAVIWPVSHGLCYAFLDQVRAGLQCLQPSQLGDWVRAILDVYEEQGLKQAGLFMTDVEKTYLCRLRGETGLTFNEAVGLLLPYVRGLSGRQLDLAPAADTYTDTVTIFLPREVTLFTDNKDNFLYYKLLVTFQWGLIAAGIFRDRALEDFPEFTEQDLTQVRQTDGRMSLDSFVALFEDRRLLLGLYQIFATVRVFAWLRANFRGLIKDSHHILRTLTAPRRRPDQMTDKGRIIAAGNRLAIRGEPGLLLPPREQDIFAVLQQAATEVAGRNLEPMRATLAIYARLVNLPGAYKPVRPYAIQGLLKPGRVAAARERRRRENRQRFIEALALMLQAEEGKKPPTMAPEWEPWSPARPESDAGLLVGSGPGPEQKVQPTENGSPQEFIQVAGRDIRLPASLRELAREISADFGSIPERYISSAMQMAGGAASGFTAPPPEEGPELTGPLVYDEWDFRRAGFRKNWCTLLQKELRPVTSTFLADTLSKYRGSLVRLKKEFEMLRLQDRFARRQSEGNDIDFDAAVEALCDYQAGLAPSENLFIRLQRDQRDIAVVFLVDMSSSTEGWVSKTLKEALVLMSEALEALGDRYAIYGFSGMRRLRSELYHIKHLNEGYTEQVKGRIAAITPIDYTRMGPPIRHVTALLDNVEARVRLLITLSDGKPEDYDDYKGDYAVEDTRHALIEARSAGIHPFCITIDKKAHGYMAHMYGEVNYIIIDDVNKLPMRVPEIYRTLTT